MRTVTFTLTERVVLIPIEVVVIIKKSILPITVVAVAMGLQLQGIMFGQMVHLTTPLLIGLGIGIFSGTVLHPMVMPFLIVRSFAVQGFMLGLISSLVVHFTGILSGVDLFGKIAVYLLIVALSSYQAFNFTGSTPIANKSGVKREFKIAIPLYIGTAIVTAVLAILYKISAEGLL